MTLVRAGSGGFATGDFDDDGWLDVAGGAPDSTTDGLAEAGAIVVCWGHEDKTPVAMVGAGWFNLDGCSSYAPADLIAGDRWGGQLVTMPGSSGDTLIVAAPGRTVDVETRAKVWGLRFREEVGGGRRRIDAGKTWTLDSRLPVSTPGGDAEMFYGEALAVEDVNDDGRLDLSIGVPGYDLDDDNGGWFFNAGAVEHFWGTAAVSGTPPFVRTAGGQTRLANQSPVRDGAFGKSLAFGRFNAARELSLAIGAGRESAVEGSVTFSPAANSWSPSDDWGKLPKSLTLGTGPSDAVSPGAAQAVDWDVGGTLYVSEPMDGYANALAVVPFKDAPLPDLEQYRDPPRDLLVVGAPGASGLNGPTPVAGLGFMCLVRNVDEEGEFHQWCENGGPVEDGSSGLPVVADRRYGADVDASFHFPVPTRFSSRAESFEVVVGAPGVAGLGGPGFGAVAIRSFALPMFDRLGVPWDRDESDEEWIPAAAPVALRDLSPPTPLGWSTTLPSGPSSLPAGAAFGTTVLSADLDSLGIDEVVIGAPGLGDGVVSLHKTDFGTALDEPSGYYHTDVVVPPPTEGEPYPWDGAWNGSTMDLLILKRSGGPSSGLSLWSETNRVMTLTYGLNAQGTVPGPTDVAGLHACAELPLNALGVRPDMLAITQFSDSGWRPHALSFSGCAPDNVGEWPDYTSAVHDEEVMCDPDGDEVSDFVLPKGMPEPKTSYDLEPMYECGYAPEAAAYPPGEFDRPAIMSPIVLADERQGTEPDVFVRLSAANLINAAFGSYDVGGFQVAGAETADITLTAEFPDPATATLSWDLIYALEIIDGEGNPLLDLPWLAINEAPASALQWSFSKTDAALSCEGTPP